MQRLAFASMWAGFGASGPAAGAAFSEASKLLNAAVPSVALSAIVAARVASPSSVVSPVGLLAVVALGIGVVAETGRLPVDNPSTHLELTMVHEAMVLESSGRDLVWLEVGSWLRLTALLGLLVNLAVPWGVATTLSVQAVLVGVAAIVVKLVAAGIVVAAGEVFVAKLRLFRVPELLAGSFVLAFLAVTASFLIGGAP